MKLLFFLTLTFALIASFATGASILSGLTTISTVASTVPSNGDINPYGVVVVSRSVGMLKAGRILVSNFNGSANLQGTGTTIVQISPSGAVSLFADIDARSLPGACPGGVGLTTALAVLSTGWVIVGSLPTIDGTAATAAAGCLIVLNSNGQPVETIAGDPINGPWDMTWTENKTGTLAQLFVSNVLNGTVAAGGKIVNKGTVVRIDLNTSMGILPAVQSVTVIGSGFPERTDPAALVIGPTGVGLKGRNLFVANSLRNRITVISDARTRTTSAGNGSILTSGGSLNDPLGLIVAGGNILTVNGNDGIITEISPQGVQVATKQLDSTGSPPGAGTLFGLVLVQGRGLYFVDDGSNTLNLLH